MAQEKPKSEKTVADIVLARVNHFKAFGELRIPKDYNPENALKSAWLILQDIKTKDDKPVLDVCDKNSIAQSLFDMVIQGLSPMKKQCAFIAYGKKLTLVREYHGTIALAKRFGNVKEPIAEIIYEGDSFEYEVNPLTGKKKIVKHEQKFENIDPNKIKGAYCVLTFDDDREPYVEVMNIFQIKTAWNQGAMKGNSPAHKNFPDEMAKKTVIGRACKLYISSSDDGGIYEDIPDNVEEARAEIKAHSGKENLDIEDTNFEEVKSEPEKPAPKDNKPKPGDTQPEKTGAEKPETKDNSQNKPLF